MVKKQYMPERGDIIWINFTPQAGHEQAGKRPAIVISPSSYNSKTGLMIACPITSKIKNYPFEVQFIGRKISGVVLSDQVKNIDWRVREAAFIEEATETVFSEVQEKLALLIK
ncbi:MAG: endoribonuclease MazF [Spirochaetales bacterium]|nr:endoribonuclease MazF [Spirochaetales bacterium]